MSICPSPDRWLRLLRDDPTQDDQAELAAHLETCTRCRATLDRLAAQSGIWHDLSLLRDPAIGMTSGGSLKEDTSADDDEEIPLGLLEPPDEAGQLGRIGPYDILRVIGRGGMGIVFLARDRALDRLVAIKLLRPGMAATGAARRRFAREARAAAAVVHEHVVTIHAVDMLPQGVPYLVMQYVAGRSVQELIDEGKAPELAQILRIGSQAAGALAAAHAQGLIHRDIKPANILLEDDVDRVKITDFGLARAVDDVTISLSGMVAGTPQYMSPEQACGEPIDHRTDLFSLGSVLYALCTGQAPFRGNSSMATLRKVCEHMPRPILSFNPEIPSWLVKVIDRLHAKNPADRYGSASEVALLLGGCLAHVQQPATIPLPAGLLPARNRRAIALWGALPVVLMLAILLGSPGARQAAGRAVGYMAVMLRLKTPEGTLVIEADDPNLNIKLDGNDLFIHGAGVKELRVSVGPHSVQALKDGKVLRDELVSITRGGRAVLKVRREAEPEPTRASKAKADQLRVALALLDEPHAPAKEVSQEVERMAEALKLNPPPPRNRVVAGGMRLFMRDLVEGRTYLIVEPLQLGMAFAEMPDWSHDGKRIIFQIQPSKNDWTQTLIVTIEVRDGKPHFQFLGTGCCVSFSPDGRKIAFTLVLPDNPGDLRGNYLMDSDGTNRQHIGEFAPMRWSPDGKRLAFNKMVTPTEVTIYDVATKERTVVNVPGQTISSWARWVGNDRLVASIGAVASPDSLALLDVSQPAQSKVVKTLWKRSTGPDVFARWPIISAATGDLFFTGDDEQVDHDRTIYTLPAKAREGDPPIQLDTGGFKLSGLSLSPDGRYLLFASDRLDGFQ